VKIGITCYPTYGGSGAIATELGIELAQRGHEIHFISYAQPFRLPHFMERVYFHEVDDARYPLFEYSPYPLTLAVMMHEVAIREELDLLHVHYAIPHATSAWIAREMLGEGHGLKIITTLHGTDITLVGQDRSYWPITRFSIAKSDGITAVSDFLKQETVDHFQVPPADIEVIHNFVDTTLYDRDRYPCRKQALLAPGEKMVMHVSNFRKVKRVGRRGEVVRRHQRGGALAPGAGGRRAGAPGRHRRGGAAGGQRPGDLSGAKQDSVAELMACADLLLLPSQTESFGLVALEAMAAGVPVVASAVGGLPEVVEDGVNGFLRPVGATDEMADAAVSLLRDPARWREFSRSARSVARERFGADVVVPQYERYYERVLAGEGAAADLPLARAGGE
jgi:N-acetyl-alpha-D-glucosaminyl L-malate synthase BshA